MTLESGFVLTRQAKDINGKSHIELWLATDQGPTQLIIEGEQAVFFIEQTQIQACQAIAKQQQIAVNVRPLELKDFSQQSLAACYFASHYQASKLAQALHHENIITLEADIKLADRYLMERFIQGSLEFT
ncbi:MAG: DNA polymerase II, partial [Vibrio metschnikovii]|nr:DNA polymerase II [Vibrio metschnikovii]